MLLLCRRTTKTELMLGRRRKLCQKFGFTQHFLKNGRRKNSKRCLRINKLQNHCGHNNRMPAKQQPLTRKKLRRLKSQRNGGGLQKISSFYSKGFRSQWGQFKIDPLSLYGQQVKRLLGGCNVITAAQSREQREAALCHGWEQQAASCWKPY